ncbi:hypothetical protein RTCIAT899_PC06465 (plasmid) [Rhizobium tropici CIAT 899]|uniref:UrcA family protein n=1 Tax=Rhizobium tropici TaxID=398 RepID=A0ABR6R288_RHITR|nr:hypothetical protein RTCIAT899_PC06465 [Rhizobium tropici CIAT 899]MBB4242971.1 hypothetical protein [Rhizobium tropici]MBB5594614.1 hypothetical protein [Rhizobium tropici]MBB6493297.1 hypothetical protein [Rhizobium tropici]TGE95681.1 hypothetical protein C9417_19485 [Rhizobium sp. SEMIA 4088]
MLQALLRPLLLAALSLTILPASSRAESVPSTGLSLPAEVEAFIIRRNDCDHFRGEASPDASRQAQIDRELRRLCTGTDVALARLLKRYAKNAKVQGALADYERNIEGN